MPAAIRAKGETRLLIVKLLEKKSPMTRPQIAKAVEIQSGLKTLKSMVKDDQIQLAGVNSSGTQLYAAKSRSITKTPKRVLARNVHEPDEVQRRESLTKKIASFWDPGAKKKTENVQALGESHALAMRYECKDAAAVICQTIAALMPRESGYAVICDVSLTYQQHYNQHKNRQWHEKKSKQLELYKHDLANIAIENINEIEKIYKDCLGSYKSMSNAERKKAAALFRERMQERYGDVRQNAWTHETVYQALVDRDGRVKQSQLNRYVTLYEQERNCAILYAPNSKDFAKKPFHTNDSRPDWKKEVFDRLEVAVEKVSEDKHKGKQNFVQYAVLDWTQFAEAVDLTNDETIDQPTLTAHEAAFAESVRASLEDDPKERRRRLKKAPKLPKRTKVIAYVYSRNSDVVAEVRIRAKGKCESCGRNAPFMRRSDDSPYLEVHHRKMLADGGEDTVENAEALCPNCHREKHYG